MLRWAEMPLEPHWSVTLGCGIFSRVIWENETIVEASSSSACCLFLFPGECFRWRREIPLTYTNSRKALSFLSTDFHITLYLHLFFSPLLQAKHIATDIFMSHSNTTTFHQIYGCHHSKIKDHSILQKYETKVFISFQFLLA